VEKRQNVFPHPLIKIDKRRLSLNGKMAGFVVFLSDLGFILGKTYPLAFFEYLAKMGRVIEAQLKGNLLGTQVGEMSGSFGF